MNSLEELKNKMKKNPEDKKIRFTYAEKLYDKIISSSRENKIEVVEKLLKEFLGIITSHMDDEKLMIIYAKATLNTLPLFFGSETPTELKSRILQIRNLVTESNNSKLKEIYAMILVNAIYDFSLKRHIPSINEYALELTDLARKNPKNDTLQETAAKGLMNTTMFFYQNKDVGAAKKYYKTLNRILMKNPDKEMVDTRKLMQLRKALE